MSPIEPAKKRSSVIVVIALAVLLLVALLTGVPYLVSIALAEGPVGADASPIFGVTRAKGHDYAFTRLAP